MTDSHQTLKSLGSKTTQYNYDRPYAKLLESFENNAGAIVIPFICNEFTSICPVTGQPDYAKLEIVYIPNDRCIESKSLKLYLHSFRNHGAFHEEVTDLIMQDIFKKISPQFIRIFGDFHVRGGISIKPLALKFQENLSDTKKEEIKYKIENYDRLRHWDFNL